jgi:hypothetical protein
MIKLLFLNKVNKYSELCYWKQLPYSIKEYLPKLLTTFILKGKSETKPHSYFHYLTDIVQIVDKGSILKRKKEI